MWKPTYELTDEKQCFYPSGAGRRAHLGELLPKSFFGEGERWASVLASHGGSEIARKTRLVRSLAQASPSQKHRSRDLGNSPSALSPKRD
jgi:hypothetical protein